MKYNWKEIKGFPGYWAHAKLGVKSKRRLLKTFENASGYLQYTLHRGGRSYKRMAHRLFWESAFGPIKKGLEINHKDGNKKNNSLSNLEVVTWQENIEHALRTGLCTPCKPIVIKHIKTGELRKFRSRWEVVRFLGTSSGNIYDLINGRRPTLYGWRVKSEGEELVKIKVYYWQAADRIVAVTRRGVINILSEDGDGFGTHWFDIELPPSRLPKTLVYLGEL